MLQLNCTCGILVSWISLFKDMVMSSIANAIRDAAIVLMVVFGLLLGAFMLMGCANAINRSGSPSSLPTAVIEREP